MLSSLTRPNAGAARRRRGALAMAALLSLAAAPVVESVESEFIFETAPFASCHASTIEETRSGTLIAAWFGGTEEGHTDVGIWVSRQEDGVWSPPAQIASGHDPDTNRRYPCWNPVLFQPEGGPLFLYYKVGPNPREWWGLYLTSKDNGYSWSEPVKLRKGVYGPIKNKPLDLGNGVMLAGSSTEDAGWRVHMETSRRFGKLWTRTKPLHAAITAGAIQPAILNWGDNGLQILCRTRQRKILESWSQDRGNTWSPVALTQLPNSNSGLDAVTLSDGRALLVYNHTTRGRSPLNIAVSANGRDWTAGLVLEDAPGEYSYPAIIQTSDGLAHVTYTWKRTRIKHVVVDPKELSGAPIVDGVWP